MFLTNQIRCLKPSNWPNWSARTAARRRWVVVLAALVCIGLSWQSRSAIAQGMSREYPLKAAYIFKFGSYVEWPPAAFADAESPFVIGIVGRSPIEASLRQIAAANQVGGRKLEVVRFDSVDQIQPCQILFVAGTLPVEQQVAAIERVRGTSVLTIGESPNFAAQGGAVRFFIDNNKLRFEINVNSTRLHQLKVSSQLLALARVLGAAN